MDAYRAIMLTDGGESGTEEEELAAWQFLLDTGLGERLGGHFARTIAEMRAEGRLADGRASPVVPRGTRLS